jgi:hypothetical protein
MKTFEPIVELKLSIQRALVGEVADNLFAVTAGIKGNWIKIIAYFKGPVSEEDIERIQCVSTEVIADFPDGYMIEEAALSLDEREPECLDFWALKKAE